jgi:hypothetical protein
MVMPLAGELCESEWGWPALYYILGATSFVSFLLFYWFYRDSPRIQKNVSPKELTKIEEGKTIIDPPNQSEISTEKCRKPSTSYEQRPPYRAMV